MNKIIKTKTTEKVEYFYSKNPFPSYQVNENKLDILIKGDRNILSKQFKIFAGSNKKILEAGCGTAQLSCYLAISSGNILYSLDATKKSLEVAQKFFDKEKIKNIKCIEGDLLNENILPYNFFDIIWCSGVLHHTENPYLGFQNLTKFLKKDGYLVIGLYNRYTRLRTNIRRYIYSKIKGKKNKHRFLFLFDPILRKMKKNLFKNRYKIFAWIMDQYDHIVESQHTIDEVFEWFNNNGIEATSYFPNNFYYTETDFEKFFNKRKLEETSFIERILLQIYHIFGSIGSEGGIFLVIGRKKN